jgi:hypothetical protein
MPKYPLKNKIERKLKKFQRSLLQDGTHCKSFCSSQINQETNAFDFAKNKVNDLKKQNKAKKKNPIQCPKIIFNYKRTKKNSKKTYLEIAFVIIVATTQFFKKKKRL